MVKVGECALLHKKWTFRVELTKKTSHCKSRDFLRKRRQKISTMNYIIYDVLYFDSLVFFRNNYQPSKIGKVFCNIFRFWKTVLVCKDCEDSYGNAFLFGEVVQITQR